MEQSVVQVSIMEGIIILINLGNQNQLFPYIFFFVYLGSSLSLFFSFLFFSEVIDALKKENWERPSDWLSFLSPLLFWFSPRSHWGEWESGCVGLGLKHNSWKQHLPQTLRMYTCSGVGFAHNLEKESHTRKFSLLCISFYTGKLLEENII